MRVSQPFQNYGCSTLWSPAQGREGDVYQFTEEQTMKMIVLHLSALNQKILRHPSFLYIKLESESGSVVSDSLQLYSPWNSPGQNTGVGSLSLLQGIFPTQGSNSSLLHCRRIVYQLSHKGSPRILEWVAYPFLQRIFPTQELNQGLLHCRRIFFLPTVLSGKHRSDVSIHSAVKLSLES